jgi:RimJ/RimL family protein N-acetyltransferase
VTVILHALLLEIPESIETERLRLEATRPGGGKRIQAAVEDSRESLALWMPWARDSSRGAEDAERHCREMTAKWHAREELDYCFTRKSDGVLVGKGSLHTIDWTIPRMEIGYWVRTGCARQGYATEGTLALVELARDLLGARRVEIGCDARNVASRRVAERSGFVLEGIRRHARRDLEGAIADSCMYARIF